MVPLSSFGKGLRHIMASDQDPYFLNYSLQKEANMMFELMKARSRVIHSMICLNRVLLQRSKIQSVLKKKQPLKDKGGDSRVTNNVVVTDTQATDYNEAG